MRKRWILAPLPLPRFRFHKIVVVSLVAIPPTNAEAAGLADRFRIPAHNWKKMLEIDVFNSQTRVFDIS